MQQPYVFDIETNGFLDACTTVHCLVIRCPNGNVTRFRGAKVVEGVRWLEELANAGEFLAGHNVIKFDIPVLEKLYGFSVPKAQVLDTLVLARLAYPDIRGADFDRIQKGRVFPKNLVGQHSLEAWGHRLGEYKGGFKGPWEVWTQAMEDYCEQDTVVTRRLFDKLNSLNLDPRSILLEHGVAWVCALQERAGFAFDVTGAARLYATMVAEKLAIERKLKEMLPPQYVFAGTFKPARDNRALGYVAGAEFTKVKLMEFNPSSRDHIALWLMRLRGWKPTEYTATAKPKVDEVVLGKLRYPEAPLLTDFLTLEKRLGQLAEGPQAWLKQARNGRIHGSVNTNGAVTGRATHAYPNLAQVPSVRVNKAGEYLLGLPGGYGAECRALFGPSPGRVLVGADLSGIELRCLAHFMARWDNGDYGNVILTGDIHTANQLAAGLPTRSDAKTFIYAFLYGAGDEKLGKITGKGAKEGARLRREFLANIPALGHLVRAVKAAAARGYLIGLDGRKLPVRSEHSALNTLLQSAGALVAKRWLVEIETLLVEAGIRSRCQQVAWIHDEVQIEADPEVAEQVGKVCVLAAQRAGEYFGFRIPVAAEFKVGNNWKETH